MKPTQTAINRFGTLPESHRKNLKGYGLGFPDDDPGIEIFTCADCPAVAECVFAFDAYNTNGDCLAEK